MAQQFINEPTSTGGLAPHESEILWGKHDARKIPGYFRCLHRCPIDLGAIGRRRVQLELGEDLSIAVLELRADDRRTLSVSNQRMMTGDAV